MGSTFSKPTLGKTGRMYLPQRSNFLYTYMYITKRLDQSIIHRSPKFSNLPNKRLDQSIIHRGPTFSTPTFGKDLTKETDVQHSLYLSQVCSILYQVINFSILTFGKGSPRVSFTEVQHSLLNPGPEISTLDCRLFNYLGVLNKKMIFQNFCNLWD